MSLSMPPWLPPLFNVSPWDQNTYDLLYEIFHRDFIATKTYCRQSHVGVSNALVDGKEKTFWHITTREDKKQAQRLPDFRRSERLPWLKQILENSHEPEILAWEYIEGDGSINLYIWLKAHDYIAILKKIKKRYVVLVTAYWIEFPNTKRKLMKKYNARNKEANA
ncbi:MAG: hypothetical protein JO131_05755 [Gammaproteobacteria bacterium]|nr:hypothetical protein [Gammaproteobacteria bacterium]